MHTAPTVVVKKDEQEAIYLLGFLGGGGEREGRRIRQNQTGYVERVGG